jgi:type IV fimbrial biogenesis protein FimT
MQQGADRPRRALGFTLIESLVVLAVAAVLVSLAIPAMSRMLARHRLVTAQLDLIASLGHARNLAIASGRRTLLCPSVDGVRCAEDTHWERGWVVGNYRSDKASQLDGPPLLVHGGYAHLVITSTSGRTRIRFQPLGTSGGSTVTFTLCRQGHPAEALAVKVSIVGRIAAAKADADQAARCAAGG